MLPSDGSTDDWAQLDWVELASQTPFVIVTIALAILLIVAVRWLFKPPDRD